MLFFHSNFILLFYIVLQVHFWAFIFQDLPFIILFCWEILMWIFSCLLIHFILMCAISVTVFLSINALLILPIEVYLAQHHLLTSKCVIIPPLGTSDHNGVHVSLKRRRSRTNVLRFGDTIWLWESKLHSRVIQLVKYFQWWHKICLE